LAFYYLELGTQDLLKYRQILFQFLEVKPAPPRSSPQLQNCVNFSK